MGYWWLLSLSEEDLGQMKEQALKERKDLPYNGCPTDRGAGETHVLWGR